MRPHSLRLRLARPDDAAAIAANVAAAYGQGYAEPAFLDPRRVRAALRAGRVLYAIAEDSGGRAVAQCALEDLGRGRFEHSKAVVLPEHRGAGLMGALSRLLYAEARRRGVRLLLGRSVTCHLRTQRCTARAGYVPLGLLANLWPARCIAGRAPDGPPVSCLLEGLPLAPLPARPLALRGAAGALAQAALSRLGAEVVLLPEDAGESGAPPRFAPRRRPLLGLLHFAPLPPEVPRGLPLARALEAEARVVWLDQPVAAPGADRLAATLFAWGFFPAAFVPWEGPGGADVLRWQRCTEALPELEELVLLPTAREFCRGLLAGAGATV
ncbi:MAG: hypothetical protein D6731_00970 [Planctomycetota bacterium]|nr:MAG: hypothetical protein D6731_00970 [Planctomycetota bacterium]